MPVIAKIGIYLNMPEVVVIGSAFAVSAAMALPFSSFPNVNSLLMLDDFQKPYLKVSDFIKTGLPMSLITILLIATLGYSLINIIVVNHRWYITHSILLLIDVRNILLTVTMVDREKAGGRDRHAEINLDIILHFE